MIAITALFLVTACFCRSDRETVKAPAAEPKNIAVATPTPLPSLSGSGEKRADNGDFLVEKSTAGTSRFREIDDRVRAEKLLEKAADQLNRSLSLPHDIPLRTKECGEQNAFYDPKDRSVTICYELMDRFHQTFRLSGMPEEQASEKMFHAIRFVFLHEVGHALIDAYNVPITGNEEDAADRLSAFVNLRELGEDGVQAVLAAADAFAIESKQAKPAKKHLADEHLLQEQRFYNSLCMIYGSDPAKHSDLVKENYLPRERADRCQYEYRKNVDSWMRLLEPWRKN